MFGRKWGGVSVATLNANTEQANANFRLLRDRITALEEQRSRDAADRSALTGRVSDLEDAREHLRSAIGRIIDLESWRDGADFGNHITRLQERVCRLESEVGITLQALSRTLDALEGIAAVVRKPAPYPEGADLPG